MKQSVFGTILLMLCCAWAPAKLALDPATLTLPVGGAMQLKVNRDNARELKWTSENVKAAGVYVNGFVVGLTPGEAVVHVSAPGGEEAACRVKVTSGESELVNPATLQQYSDNRVFHVGKRKCVGSVLNGHMVGNDAQKTDRNRVLNPRPLRKDQPLEWELVEGTPIYDGTGAIMGTAAPDLDIGGRKVANTRFNYGFSKVVKGRFCVYGFVVSMKPDASMVPLLDAESRKQSIVNTSAWVPLDGVVEKETLLELVGVGKGKLPKLPLDTRRFRITGGNPEQFQTANGELRIVDDPDAAPVPSHYLRRPTGTVNVIYCVPGFSIGGQSLDSFLISSNAIFRPARGMRVFVQPTYYPKGHPRAGKKSSKTMTFMYGAVEVEGSETVYGWVAREAMEPISESGK